MPKQIKCTERVGFDRVPEYPTYCAIFFLYHDLRPLGPHIGSTRSRELGRKTLVVIGGAMIYVILRDEIASTRGNAWTKITCTWLVNFTSFA